LPVQAATEPRCRGARKLQDRIRLMIRIRAWRGVLADLMSVSKFSVLEYRMTEIEEELEKRRQGDPGAPEILRG
jgi:hypothetical protein